MSARLDWLLDGQSVTRSEIRTTHAGEMLGQLTVINTGTRSLFPLWIYDGGRRAEFSCSKRGPFRRDAIRLGRLSVGSRASVWARVRRRTEMEAFLASEGSIAIRACERKPDL